MLHVVTRFCVILRFNTVRIIYETAKIMRVEFKKNYFFCIFPAQGQNKSKNKRIICFGMLFWHGACII